MTDPQPVQNLIDAWTAWESAACPAPLYLGPRHLIAEANAKEDALAALDLGSRGHDAITAGRRSGLTVEAAVRAALP